MLDLIRKPAAFDGESPIRKRPDTSGLRFANFAIDIQFANCKQWPPFKREAAVLKTPADFPHPGATAFVAPHGEKVRIIQRNEDGSFLIAHQRHPDIKGSASDTFRAEPEMVHATEEAAIGKRPAKKRRAA